MTSVNVAVVYYSSTGTNYQLAQAAEQAAKEAGAEVRLRRVSELAPQAAIDSNPAWKTHYEATKDLIPVATLEDLEWADTFIFSAPTRFGNMPSQMKQFFDLVGPLWAQGKLANKVVTAMSSAQNPHGGQEATILSMYTTMYHWGAIVVAPGYTNPAVFSAGGNPYGTTATMNSATVEEPVLAAARHQSKRAVEIAQKLKG